MVGPQGAGSIIVVLMVVAQIGLPERGDVLIDVDLPTQRHHQEDTYEARGGGVGLDGLLGVSLDHVPQLPDELGVEDVEGLCRVEESVLNVGGEEVIVGAL